MICGALQTLNEEALEDVLLGDPVAPGEPIPPPLPLPLATIRENHSPCPTPSPPAIVVQYFPTDNMPPPDQHDCTQLNVNQLCMNNDSNSDKDKSTSGELDEFTLTHISHSVRESGKVRFEKPSAKLSREDQNLEPTIIIMPANDCDQTIVNLAYDQLGDPPY